MAGATAALRRGGVDVVLADLTLPDAYGLDVIRRCRAVAPNVPIIDAEIERVLSGDMPLLDDSALGDIERQLEHHVTGRYSAAFRHPMA